MAGLASLATYGMRFVAEDQVTETLSNVAKKFKWLNKVSKNAIGELSQTVKDGGLAGKVAMGSAAIVANELLNTFNKLADGAVLALKSITKAAANFQQEMKMFGVIAGASAEEIATLRIRILEVTGPLPTSANQVAKAATAFAKMGFAADGNAESLIRLANQAVMFGRAIRATDEQAALFIGKLAQWLQVTDRSAENLGRVASMVTKLGWRVKGTAQDVIKATERFGAFVRAMGATEAQTVSLAGLVVDSGILIRRGSTAINRSFQLMASNTAAFGRQMAKMQVVASPEVWENMLATDPVKAFEKVLFALSKTGGIQATTMLKQLGLHGNYISDLITMSRNVNQLGKFIKETSAEMDKQNGDLGATQKAFDSYTTTFNAAMETLKGAWENVKIIMGSPLLATFTAIIGAVVWLIDGIIQSPLGRFLLEVAGTVLALAAVLLVLIKIMFTLKLAMWAIRSAGIATFLAWLPLLAKIVLVVGVIFILISLVTHAMKKWNGEAGSLTDTMKELGTSAKEGLSSLVPDGSSFGVPVTEAPGTKVASTGGGGTPAIEAPGAARGGLFVKPTPVVIGEAGPEVAMSTGDLMAMMSNFFEQMAGSNQGGGGEVTINTPITLDGQIVAQSVANAGNLDDLRRGEIG